MKKNIFFVSLAIISISLFYNCSKKPEITKPLEVSMNSDNVTTEDFIITNTEAQEIASNFDIFSMQKTEINTLKSKTNKQKKLKNKKTFKDKTGKDAIHIFNYEMDGHKSFVIVSGDKRLQRILAFSNKNNFNFENDMPDIITFWLNSKIEKIENLRETNLKISKQNNENVIKHNLPGDDEHEQDGGGNFDGTGCTSYDYIYQAGPLLETDWGQGLVYNQFFPGKRNYNIYCYDLPDDNIYTTSPVTAMAQLMKYHGYPTSYLMNNMENSYFPDNYNYASQLTAQLMLDVAYQIFKDDYDSVDDEYKFMWCWDFVPLNTLDRIKEALLDGFNYTDAETDIFWINYELVKDNLKNGYPVILKAGCINTKPYAWVCDGYQVFQNSCETLLFFHMNWGLDIDAGSDYDGWYGIFDFSLTHEYEYGVNGCIEVLLNIKP